MKENKIKRKVIMIVSKDGKSMQKSHPMSWLIAYIRDKKYSRRCRLQGECGHISWKRVYA